MADYCRSLSPFMMNGNEINVPFVRTAVEAVFAGMNLAASEKFGYQQPRNTVHKLLEKAGVSGREPHQYFRPLDDRYWDEQFLSQHELQGLIRRADGEEDLSYTTRYVFACLKGFAFGNFSYIQQAHSVA